MLRVYLDDSGSQDGPNGVFAVAGYMGDSDQLEYLQRDWTRVLSDFNNNHGLAIAHLHMTDLVAGRRQFEGISKDLRAVLLFKLCKLATVRTMMGVGSYVKLEDYISVLGDPNAKRLGIPAPLTLCAEGAFVMAKCFAPPKSRRPIAFVIEKGSKNRGDLLMAFDRANKDRELEELMSGDTISQEGKELAVLQLADIYAWSLAATNKREYNIPREFRVVLHSFLHGHPHGFWPYDVSHLEEGKKNLLERINQRRQRMRVGPPATSDLDG